MSDIPLSVLGSAPGWLLLMVVSVAVIRVWPKIQQIRYDARDKAESRDAIERENIAAYYRKEIDALRDEVRLCRETCQKQEAILEERIQKLNEQIYGMRRQHIQEQISLVNAVIQSLGEENSTLKQMLSGFESVHRALREVEVLGGLTAQPR